MSEQEITEFDDLNLQLGETIHIYPDVNDKKSHHDCLLLGALPGESLIVSASQATGLFPSVTEGQQVAIRIKSSHGLVWFTTIVLCITDNPLFMVFLDYPQDIHFKRIRNAARVDIALPILVSNLDETSLSPTAGKLCDISLGGARLELYDNIGEVNDEIQIKGKFQIGSIQKMLSLKASLKNKTLTDGGRFNYGIAFGDNDEDNQLILYGYVFQSMAFGSVQTIT